MHIRLNTKKRNDPWLLHFAIFVFLHKLRSSTIKGHFCAFLVSNIIFYTSHFYGLDSVLSFPYPPRLYSSSSCDLFGSAFSGRILLQELCLWKPLVGITCSLVAPFPVFWLHYTSEHPVFQARILHKFINRLFVQNWELPQNPLTIFLNSATLRVLGCLQETARRGSAPAPRQRTLSFGNLLKGRLSLKNPYT